MRLFFEIGGTPVAKGRGRIGSIKTAAGPRGIIYTPQKTRDYENLVRMEATRAMDGRDPFTGPLEVEIIAYLGVPAGFSKLKTQKALVGVIKPCTKPDIDNYVKAALDGMNGVVYRDDNQVVILKAAKLYRIKPGLAIGVKELLTTEVL